MQLTWLPVREDWNAQLRSAGSRPAGLAVPLLRELAHSRMSFLQVGMLDRALQRRLKAGDVPSAELQPVRLALLGSSTTSHLVPGIRVAGLRRGLAIEVYENAYGMYMQELGDAGSQLHSFRPEVVLFALDARHVAGAEGASSQTALELMSACWRQAKAAFHCQVIQQTILPVLPDLMGNNEARLAHSPAAVVAAINAQLPDPAEREGVDLLALDRFAGRDGLACWHDPALWYRAKHEVHPQAAEMYGEQLIRLVAASRGLSAKCLVLDLDNTLWGGVIGDDGVEGIELGQGSSRGEAFLDFQRYARQLRARGVVLAICSKNDESNALEPFERHPEMVLRRDDFACIRANWEDKASNLRSIAKTLHIGLDALVFVDDNPVERALVRRELPMVSVPELPEDPALYSRSLAAAGYFEALHLTPEDVVRSAFYDANHERESLKGAATDMAGYLASLDMVLTLQPFDSMNLKRITQLINKTNQFNLTTERLCEAQVAARMNDPDVLTLQARLSDRFGDNGVIAVAIMRLAGTEAVIEQWLMSCRVLGRRVEDACLRAMVELCLGCGVKQLTGIYRPTAKNSVVRDLYARFGFKAAGDCGPGETRWQLALSDYVPMDVPMTVKDVPGVLLQATP